MKRSGKLLLIGAGLWALGLLSIAAKAGSLAVVLIVPANLILAASMNVGQHEQQRGQWKPGFARWSALLFAWFAIALGVHLNSPAWYEHLSTFQTIGLYTIWSLPVPFVAVRAYREQQDGGIFR